MRKLHLRLGGKGGSASKGESAMSGGSQGYSWEKKRESAGRVGEKEEGSNLIEKTREASKRLENNKRKTRVNRATKQKRGYVGAESPTKKRIRPNQPSEGNEFNPMERRPWGTARQGGGGGGGEKKRKRLRGGKVVIRRGKKKRMREGEPLLPERQRGSSLPLKRGGGSGGLGREKKKEGKRPPDFRRKSESGAGASAPT